MEADNRAAGSSGRNRRRNRRGKAAPQQEEEPSDKTASAVQGGGGRTVDRSVDRLSRKNGPSLETKGVVHHHPPKETASDCGHPVRGGSTLLIAYFPYEASEADIEREFSKISRVKRVHLVVDKSSRKPRCFGFVKFVSKADAEEALHAAMKGAVQLSDTRGHVWHLKAEWTKSGDMVVDDSDTELEVAKRREQRRARQESAPSDGGKSPQAKMGTNGEDAKQMSAKPLHPGVPAPLPPLVPAPLPPLGTGYPSQVPMLHPGALGVPPAPSLQQQQMYAGAQSLPMYGPYAGQPAVAPLPYPGLAGAALPGGGVLPQPALGSLFGGVAGAPHQAYGVPHSGYPPQSMAYAAPHQLQGGFIAQQGAYAGQPAGLSQHTAHVAAANPQAGCLNQHTAYAASLQYVSPQQPTYPTGCPPPLAAYAAPNGIPPHAGYAAPPPNAAQAQAYASQLSYPAGYAGVAQPVPPHVGAYSHPQAPNAHIFAAATPAATVDQQLVAQQVPPPASVELATQQTDASDVAAPASSSVAQTAIPATGTLPSPSKTQLAGPPPGQPPPPPGPGGQSVVWNSFDDAAAKGMVDGLVGEDGILPVLGLQNKTPS